jgi:hypothetical protein
MKILLCHFADLRVARADELRLSDMPFRREAIMEADLVCVVGEGRVLLLKDRNGRPGRIMPAAEFMDAISAGVAP